MSFKPVDYSINIFSLENWERLAKLFIVSSVITILTLIIVMFVGIALDDYPNILYVVTFLIFISSNMLILTCYEKWRGCNVAQ